MLLLKDMRSANRRTFKLHLYKNYFYDLEKLVDELYMTEHNSWKASLLINYKLYFYAKYNYQNKILINVSFFSCLFINLGAMYVLWSIWI